MTSFEKSQAAHRGLLRKYAKQYSQNPKARKLAEYHGDVISVQSKSGYILSKRQKQQIFNRLG